MWPAIMTLNANSVSPYLTYLYHSLFLISHIPFSLQVSSSSTIVHAHFSTLIKTKQKTIHNIVIMMEKGSGTAVSATRSPMQVMMAPSAATGEELEGNTTSFLRTAETFLRLLPIGLCVAALVLMLKNSQENEYGSVSYNDLGAFRYLVHANGICAGYSLLSAVVVAAPRPTLLRAWTFFFLDQVLTYIILSAGASSMEVVYLAENGDSATVWNSACGSFGQFCHKVTASVAITFVALVCYVILSLISSYKLFSNYDVPATSYPDITGNDHIAPAFNG